MQGRQDIPAFLKAFTGSQRYIIDYLTEEVLALPAGAYPDLFAPDSHS